MSDDLSNTFRREVDPQMVIPSTQPSVNNVSTPRISSIPVNSGKVGFTKTLQSFQPSNQL